VADVQRRHVLRAAVDSNEVMIEIRDLQTQLVADKCYSSHIQSRHRVGDIDVEIWVPAESLDDTEPRSGAGPAVRAGLGKLPMDMVERVPDKIFVEVRPFYLHISGDIAEPPSDHLGCDPPQKIMADVHHHSPERVITQRGLRAPKGLQRP